jgi:hypothetical protein
VWPQTRSAFPDPNFLGDADADPDWHHHDADRHADPTPSSHMLENPIKKKYF